MQPAWRRFEWRDWALPAVLLVLVQLDVWLEWQRVAAGPPAVFSVIGLLACLALVERRRHPLAVLAAVAVILLIPALLGWFAESPSQVLIFVVAISRLDVTRRRRGRTWLSPSASASCCWSPPSAHSMNWRPPGGGR